MYKIEENYWYLPINKIVIKTDKKIQSEGEVLEILGDDFLDEITSYDDEIMRLPKERSKFNEIYPCTLGIIPTNSCHLRCIYCYSESGTFKDIQLSKEQVDGAINLLIRNAMVHRKFNNKKVETKISFCGGGEPTYNWEIFQYAVDTYIQKTKKYGIDSSILLITNGMIEKNKIDYIIENIDKINVSFDGMDIIQNTQRPLPGNKPSFNLVDNFIKQCEKKGKQVEIRSTVMKENFPNLKEMSNFIFTNYSNVQRLHLEPLFLVGRGELLKEPSQEELNLFAANYIKAYEFVNEKFRGKELFNSSFFYELKEYFCSSALGIHPWIHMDGKIMPCTEYINSENNILGEINEEGVSFNEKFNPLTENMSVCQKCFAYYQCGGGCVRNIIKDDSGECATNYSKKYCEMTKFFWKEVLIGLAEGKSICGLKGNYLKTVNDGVQVIEIQKN